MKRSAISPMPQFFDRYINLVEDIDLLVALKKYGADFWQDKVSKLDALGDKKYAPDKWTVKDILQHVIDNERIQAYRALRFARTDASSLPGYDEQLYGSTAGASRRTVTDLLSELAVVRESNYMLFASFTDEMLRRTGVCFNITMSVLALGFMIVGHQLHHVKVIQERYYPLL